MALSAGTLTACDTPPNPGLRRLRRSTRNLGAMASSLRLSTVILPIVRWSAEGRAKWQRAEELGFHTAYTYDHLSWREPFRDGPWFGALPTLTAAASRLRLGTLVTSVNARSCITS